MARKTPFSYVVFCCVVLQFLYRFTKRTDCFRLRRLAILKSIRNPWGPCPTISSYFLADSKAICPLASKLAVGQRLPILAF